MLAVDAGSLKSYPGTGAVWYDLSGNGNNVQLIGTPSFGSSEGYISFNGSDQYGVAYHNDTLSANGKSMTMEVWVRILDTSAGSTFFISKSPYTGGPSNQNGNYMMWAYHEAENQNLYFISNDGSDNVNLAAGNGVVSLTSNWFQYVITYNNGLFKFFRNGTLYTTTVASGPVDTKATTEDLLIGRRKDGDGALDGDLAIVNISDYALSDNDVKSNFNFYRSRFGI
jgi:hypothetical protein